jgi:hypothetical protein
MDEREKIEALYKELDTVMRRYIAEFEISAAAAIGAIEVLKAKILKDHLEKDE